MLAALRSTALARRIQFSVVPANLVLVHDVAEAELLIACALLRRYDKCQQPAKLFPVHYQHSGHWRIYMVNKVHIIPELKEKIELEISCINLSFSPFLLSCDPTENQGDQTSCGADLKSSTPLKLNSDDLMKERTHQIMQRFAKALWNVVKQDNEKLKVRYDWLAEIIFH
ncbi:hypothetical protein V6N13_120201 [Hibiscus sabdariffa]